MPGMHTFYDGSTSLQPLADAIGVDVDKVNLVVCQVLSLPLGYFNYVILHHTNASSLAKRLYPTIIGLCFCYFCYGNAIKHLISLIGLSYTIMHYLPPHVVHKCVFVFSMSYLVFIHWYRWYVLSTYSIDITGTMMVAVQKVSALAFSLHDGKVKKVEELTDIQRREALKSVPPPIEFLSYMFHYQAVLTGPVCFFTDYVSWLEGTNTIGKDGKIEKPWFVVASKLIQTLLFLVIYVKFTDIYLPEMVISDQYLKLNWFLWLMLLYIVMVLQRVPYYFVWTLADAIFNISGLGFNGYDEKGNPRWDLVSNVNAWGVETALNFKETLDSWNCCTMYWLRRVAYDRAPKKYRTVATYLLSAIWHGFSLGYYLTFLAGAMFTVAGRTVRRSFRWRFQNNKTSQRFYDVITFVITKVALSYTTLPFVMMHLGPGLYFYRKCYFFLHILTLLAIFVLPIAIAAQPKPNKESTIDDDDRKKI